MQRITQHFLRLGGLLLAAALVLGAAAAVRVALAVRPTASLPASTCTLSGTTRTCELWAKAGTLALPGASGPVTVPIWGYADSAAGPAQLPGPPLIANHGETIEVILHNTLSQPTGLLFPNQDMAPDTAGVAAGGTKTYSFSAAQPGTFVYEAGLTPNGPRQVAMGLFGALVVRPSGHPAWAYDSGSAFADEALLVYSEIDPAFNSSPASFRLQDFAPTYLLINGKAYPDTDPIAAGGGTLLLRQVNAGLRHHSIGLLGLDQTVIAADGSPLRYPYGVTAETLASGQSLDTLVAIPTTLPGGTRYPLYDAALAMGGPGGPGALGGMLAFVEAGAGTPPGDTHGPAVTALSLAPTFTNGTSAVVVAATIDDASYGGSNVTAAEYFIDTAGAAGTGTPMGGTYGGVSASASATIATSALASLSSGAHTVYVRGQDSAGNWGAVGSAVFTLDKDGPATSAIVLAPNPTSGGAAVSIQATASDAGHGNQNIAAAEYTLDGGAAQPLSVGPTAPAASLSGAIPAATVAGLPEGTHAVAIRAQDSAGNWGPYVSATLAIDRTGPNATIQSIAPSPNNGTLVYNSATNGVRIDATLADPIVSGARSDVATGEAFIDTLGAPGTGIAMLAVDSLFNSPSEPAYAVIPLAQVQALSQGAHTIYIRGKDAVGNWGVAATTALVVDKTGPAAGGVSATPNPSSGATSVALAASASDPLAGGVHSNVVAAEYYIDADPGAGNGTPMSGTFGAVTVSNLSATISTATLSGLASGSHTISVRAKDAAGNWGAVSTTTLQVDRIFANSFAIVVAPYGWSSVGGTAARLSVSTAANIRDAGTGALVASFTGGASGYVQDNSPAAETSYRARFYFNPNGTTTGTNQQHDIFVGLNGGGTTLFRVQYRRTSATGYQVRLSFRTGTGTTVTGSWVTITNAAHAIEVAWVSSSSGSFAMYVDGALSQTLNGSTSGATYRLEAVRLGPQVGPQAPSGTTLAGVSGTERFDAFVSTRGTTIGP